MRVWIQIRRTVRFPVLRLESVLGIRIRSIRMFLGLPDPDPLVIGVDPDPSLSPFLINVLSGLKECLQYNILIQNFSKKFNFLD